MDIVVYLALAVLAAVFLFSLFILIVMCHRRYEYNRLLMAHSLRFSKLHQDNLEDVIQLGPHISQKLNSNQWVEEVSGILQNCVAVLKLCHLLTDKMSKIPLNQISPQLNELICQGTTRVVPRFDILLRSMASKDVDIRVIEARVSALVTACWSLVTPFYLLSPKHKDALGAIVQKMDVYHAHLLMALEQAEQDAVVLSPTSPSTSANVSTSSSKTSTSNNNFGGLEEASNNGCPNESTQIDISQMDGGDSSMSATNVDAKPVLDQNHASSLTTAQTNSSTAIKSIYSTNQRKTLVENLSKSPLSSGVTLMSKTDEAARELLNDEAPADPSSS